MAFSSVDTGTVVTKTPLSSLSSNISFESQEGNRNKQCCAEVSALENQIKESSAKIQFAKTESERHRKAADERMIEVASLHSESFYTTPEFDCTKPKSNYRSP